MSHPSRVRGLKRLPSLVLLSKKWVAPLAGAWIETIISYPLPILVKVAPLAGAWIETDT